MSIPDALRARAARYRRMRDAIDDEKARNALQASAEQLEREAEAIEAELQLARHSGDTSGVGQ
jgi:uncharacterized protein with von Willebrand factor type A (vWA) domain